MSVVIEVDPISAEVSVDSSADIVVEVDQNTGVTVEVDPNTGIQIDTIYWAGYVPPDTPGYGEQPYGEGPYGG